MADKKTSEETAGSTPDGTEKIRAVQAGVNVYLTAQQIADRALVGAGFAESVQDAIAAALAGSNGVRVTYDDAANTITFDAAELVNAQTGTSYTFVTGDRGKLVSLSNAAAIADTLPQAGSTGFPSGWWTEVQNTGAGTLTITPTTSTIDGAATLALTTGQGARIVSNGTNWFTQRGVGSAAAGGTELKYLTLTSDTSSQADSDPGNGIFKWNNATQASATVLFMDNQTLDAVSLTTFYGNLVAGGFIYLQQQDDSTKWQLWKVSTVTSASGYYKFTVALQASGGAIGNAKAVDVLFQNGAAAGGSGTKTYGLLTPMNSQPPATNYGTLNTRNSIAVIEYDAATEEASFWVIVIPEAANLGSGLKFRIHWMGATATTGDVKWGAACERMNTDEDADSFDTEVTGTTTCSGTSGIVVVTEITVTTIDSVTAGDGFRVKVARKAADAADTMSGYAQIVAVEVRSAA